MVRRGPDCGAWDCIWRRGCCAARWLKVAPARQDLIALLDDATNEVYAAYLVEQEGTLSVMAGLKQLVERRGLFCALYTDRGSHFFHTLPDTVIIDIEGNRMKWGGIGQCCH